MAPHIPKSYTLEEVCKHGIYDEYNMAELEGKPLIDLFPRMRISKVRRTTDDMEILKRWGCDYRANGWPFVICWVDGDRQYVRFCKERAADPYEDQTRTRRRTKGLTDKEREVIEAHSD